LREGTRNIILILAAFAMLFLVCGGLAFVVAGDQIIDVVRIAVLRASLLGRDHDLNRSVSTNDEPVRFVVGSAEAPANIAARLYEQNIIVDRELFFDYMRAYRIDRQLQAGTYFLNRTLTIPEVAMALTDSRFSSIPFRIIEGWRLEQIIEAISANRLFAFSGQEFYDVVRPGAAVDPVFAARVGLPPSASLEGFLFPASYDLPPEITPLELRDELTSAFLNALDAQLIADIEAQGLTIYEVVTLASIIQREAVHADEQPLISSVYRNRLDINMKLDADPTVQYGLDNQRGGWWPRITIADYQGVASRYNTYLYTGLPPGPIAVPSLSAIRAAVYPEESPYFYFRADCRDDGYHEFARTYAEHLANGC
jgi:UPF0755 protein